MKKKKIEVSHGTAAAVAILFVLLVGAYWNATTVGEDDVSVSPASTTEELQEAPATTTTVAQVNTSTTAASADAHTDAPATTTTVAVAVAPTAAPVPDPAPALAAVDPPEPAPPSTTAAPAPAPTTTVAPAVAPTTSMAPTTTEAPAVEEAEPIAAEPEQPLVLTDWRVDYVKRQFGQTLIEVYSGIQLLPAPECQEPPLHQPNLAWDTEFTVLEQTFNSLFLHQVDRRHYELECAGLVGSYDQATNEVADFIYVWSINRAEVVNQQARACGTDEVVIHPELPADPYIGQSLHFMDHSLGELLRQELLHEQWCV